MKATRRLHKLLSLIVALCMLNASVFLAPAHATLVGTAAVFEGGNAQTERTRLAALLAHSDARTYLEANGVSPAQAQARLEQLTDAEVETIAAKMDALPAGGDLIGAAVFIFIVLLITDILGFTDVFPFVKKHR